MILFVGEQNPYQPDPSMALYPLPAQAAGGRLCSILGLEPRTYLRRYRRANLLEGHKWDRAKARQAAHDILSRDPAQRLVLLGSRVAEAFGVPFEPFRVHRARLHTPCLVLPHPSGRCRVWNDPESEGRARRAFQAFTLRPILICRKNGCEHRTKGGRDLCPKCGDEFMARLFASHPKSGETFILKRIYRKYRLRGEK